MGDVSVPQRPDDRAVAQPASTVDAVSALSAAGLVEGSVTQSSFCTGPAGTVQQQMPGSGSVVVRGSAVNLTVNQPTCNR